MNLQGIVAVSGKPGLWKALAQNKSGYVLESLDDKKTKLVANISTAKLAALDEITIFGDNEDIKLKDVFERMKAAGSFPDVKDGNKMRVYFREVAPGHDEEKVYASDIKKVITWFGILKDLPLFNEASPAVAVPVAAEEAAIAPAVLTDVTQTAPVVAVKDNIEEKTTAKKTPAVKKPAK